MLTTEKQLFIVFFVLVLLICCTKKAEQQTSSIRAAPARPTTSSIAAPIGSVVAADFLVVPGERVGPIRANSTEANLIKYLGKSVVTARDSIYDGEGNVTIGTTLYKGTGDQAHILWKDTARFANPNYVLIQPQLDETGLAARTPRWTTKAGLRYGTTLKEVERINGKAFTLYGFEWDYGGYVVDWGGGKLHTPGEKPLFGARFTYWIQQSSPTTPALEKAAEQVVGDSEFSSAHPAMQQLNPRAASMSVSF